MLDVHAPHSPTHSWKDFLFHIAAIACGLLLALALEKSVEYLHERHLLSDARRELTAELEDNRAVWQKNLTEAQRIQRALEADLKVIRALRAHAPHEGKLDYSADLYATLDGAWQSLHQNGALALMPQKELTADAWFYRMLSDMLDAITTFVSVMKINAAISASAPPDQLAVRQLDELESRTMEAQGRLEYVRMFLNYESHGFDIFGRALTGAKAAR